MRSRAFLASVQPRIPSFPDGEDDEASDSDDTDKSLLDWGPNRFTPKKPVTPEPRQAVGTHGPPISTRQAVGVPIGIPTYAGGPYVNPVPFVYTGY